MPHHQRKSIDHRAVTERQEDLLESGKYSDLTIVCGGKTWNVHRSIVCPWSGYFDVVADRDCLEGRERTIPLEDDDPNRVQQMIDCLYKSRSEFYGLGQKHEDSLFELLDVYILADKYDIPGLREWCRLAFEEETYYGMWTSAKLLALVDAAWKSLSSNHEGLLEDIIKECALYMRGNLRNLDAGDQQLAHNETTPVPDAKEEPLTEERDDSDEACGRFWDESDEACGGNIPKPLPSNHWKDLLKDSNFTTRLRQAMIEVSKTFPTLQFKYPWLLHSREGENKGIEPTLEELQRYLEMYPYRKSASK